MTSPREVAVVLLRIAVAIAFLYPPLMAYADPYAWTGFFPTFLVEIAPISEAALLHTFSAIEMLIALWILSGWRVHIPALIAAFLLLAIVLANPSQLAVLFRDISIALAAAALAWIEWTKKPPRLRV